MKNIISELNVPYETVFSDTTKEETSLRLYSELICAKKEKLQIVFTDRSVELEAGEMCYISPMTEYSVSGGGSAIVRFDLHALDIPSSYIIKVYPILGEKSSAGQKFFLIDKIYTKKIEILVEKLNEHKDVYSFDTYILMHELVSLLAVTEHDPRKSSYIERIGGYIDAHVNYQLEAVMLARMCGMSYPNFAKRFNEHYGRSCKEYITHVRIAKARRLLMNTELEVADIAAECGFFDSSHFIRTYKKKLGVTPNRDRIDYR